MTDQHPITPPPELVDQWVAEACPECRLTYDEFTGESVESLATRAAQWGADQELEACGEWLRARGVTLQIIEQLRATRRPKPPSLKEQALALIDGCNDPDNDYLDDDALATIRRALEQLDD